MKKKEKKNRNSKPNLFFFFGAKLVINNWTLNKNSSCYDQRKRKTSLIKIKYFRLECSNWFYNHLFIFIACYVANKIKIFILFEILLSFDKICRWVSDNSKIKNYSALFKTVWSFCYIYYNISFTISSWRFSVNKNFGGRLWILKIKSSQLQRLCC